MRSHGKTQGARQAKTESGILRRDDDGSRTRHFFNGLVEEIVKTSVAGRHDDDAFAMTVLCTAEDAGTWNQGVGSGATVSSVQDAERRENVTLFQASTCHSRFDRSAGADNTDRVVSLWHRRDYDCGLIVLDVRTTGANGRVNYRFGTGTDQRKDSSCGR